jgi:hypothetical protein
LFLPYRVRGAGPVLCHFDSRGFAGNRFDLLRRLPDEFFAVGDYQCAAILSPDYFGEHDRLPASGRQYDQRGSDSLNASCAAETADS